MRQRLLLDNSVGRSQTNQQRMDSLVKRHKGPQQTTKIWLNNTRNALRAVDKGYSLTTQLVDHKQINKGWIAWSKDTKDLNKQPKFG